jgi:hypothetical protein
VIGAPVKARSGIVGTSTRGEPLRRALPGRLSRRPDSDRAAQVRTLDNASGAHCLADTALCGRYASRTVRRDQRWEAAKKNQVERTI